MSAELCCESVGSLNQLCMLNLVPFAEKESKVMGSKLGLALGFVALSTSASDNAVDTSARSTTMTEAFDLSALVGFDGTVNIERVPKASQDSSGCIIDSSGCIFSDSFESSTSGFFLDTI